MTKLKNMSSEMALVLRVPLEESNEQKVMETEDRLLQIIVQIEFFIALGLLIGSLYLLRKKGIAIELVCCGISGGLLWTLCFVEKKFVDKFATHPLALYQVPSALYRRITGEISPYRQGIDESSHLDYASNL